MSSSKGPKGLPGFLRRSLRFPEEEEDDEVDEENEDTNTTNGSSPKPVAAKRSLSTGSTGNSSVKSTSPVPPPRVVRSPGQIPRPIPQVKPAGVRPPIVEEGSTYVDAAGDHATASATKTELTKQQNTSLAQSEAVPKPAPAEKEISYKQRQFEAAITSDIVVMTELKKLSWNGIPPIHRAQAWKIMLGYVPVNSSRRRTTIDRKRAEYRDAIAQHYDIDDNSRTLQEQETLRQVLVDVPRTAPEVGLFRNDRIRRSLTRLLYIWAMRHPASSYVQGINDLATPFMTVFLGDYFPGRDVLDGSVMKDVSDEIVAEVEADCYWCLTNLLAGIQDHYTSDQPGVQRMVMRLEELVNRIDAALTTYLRQVGIEFMQFSFKWMNCLLLREFNLRCVMRLWDTYISEGDGGFEDFHVYVCAAFLCQFSSQLQNMGFDELFGFMQAIPTEDWTDTEVEILLSQAYILSTLFGGSDAHLMSPR